MTATTSVRLNVWMFAVISITFKCYSSNQIKRGPPQLQEIQKMTGPYFYGIRISHCTQPLIASWEQRRSKPAKRKFKSPVISSLPSNNPLKNSPSIKRERKHQKISAGFSYGTPSANVGNSAESPMVIDSDDDTGRTFFMNNSALSKLNLDGNSNVNPTVAVKNVKIQRHLLRPYHILLPVPLSKLQQIAYRRTFDKPQFFKYLAETNLATPPERGSIVFDTKDSLLKIVNHLSLLLSSVHGHSQGSNVSYQSFENMGKLVMMFHLLNGLRNCNLTLGIAIPQGPIMNSIIKDFMKKHKLNFNVLNETANNKLLKGTTSSNDDKLTCIVFTTPLPKMSEEELPQFDLVIAYDTSFNPKKHLLHTKTNENIPTIRLVTKNTLEHAINYQMSLNQDDSFSFSNLSLFEMKRILTFGLWKKNQFVEAGCELSRFDIQGTCDKVFQWINEGMLRNLSFGMEAAVEKVWGKIPEHISFDRRLIVSGSNKERKDFKDVALAKAEKRVSDVNDEGSLKRRKVKPLTESPVEQINPNPNPMNLNKIKQQTQSPKNSRDDSSKDSRRNSLKDSSRDSYNKSRDSTQDAIKESSSTSIKKWKQKYMELLNQNKLQEEKIENLTQEKDKFCKKTNELSSELAKTRTQLGEMQSKRKRTLLEVQSIELEKTRMEMSGVQRENTKLITELESKDQEINKLKKEIDSLKNNSKSLKSKIKNLETEIQIFTSQQRLSSSSKTSKRTESLEIQVQQLEDKITTLQLQYKLKEQELKLALEDDKYHQDITNLLLQIKGKTREEMDKIHLARKNSAQSKLNNHPSIGENTSNELSIAPDNQNVSETENNPKESSSSINNTNTTSNGDKSFLGYYDSELNELPGPPLGSVISVSSTFNCHWDSCKKEFTSREELKSHLKFYHNLNPNFPNVIEIND
ncbi:5073_t:CDS:2 [Rhizophagus irregularis]|nr:5073_t:CDS:2 [Rhizophagus irregularis]